MSINNITNDPIKIIHKYKNNNRRLQYKVFIFIGSHVPEEVLNVLNLIENKDFYTALNILSIKNYEIIESFYGKYWYNFFFINYHIKAQIKLIKNTNSKRLSLENKYGKEWYKNNIDNVVTKKVSYSFSSIYYNYLLDTKKIKFDLKKTNIDFRTYNLKNNSTQSGGELLNDDTKEDDSNDDSDNDNIEEHIEDEEINLDDLTKLYAIHTIEDNKNINETTKLISEAINNKKWEKEVIENKNTESLLDNLNYDTLIEDIYKKIYITSQYIYKDDTIQIMRNKICMSIGLHTNFQNIKLLPEMQYFWTEYELADKKVIDYVMLGQKWIRKNELLKIDIKPNDNLKIYEQLRNNLHYLKDSFNYKIKREDNESYIIRNYEEFITNNEIYMLDIINELGLNYNITEEFKKNLFDVYIAIYYPFLTYDNFEQIILFLIGKNNKILEYVDNIYKTIKNDNKLTTEIENIIEDTKIKLKDKEKSKKELFGSFNENYIIHSIIHVNINNEKNISGTVSEHKYNLYRIFDNFIVDEDYPFIKYQSIDSNITYKFYSEENNNLLNKWFENISYGLSFIIKTGFDKYLKITFYETGKIEYKITWKEEDHATIKDVNETYQYIRNILKKINSENKKIKIIPPEDDRFKYAYINTIQKFSIPSTFKINHNDLSDFARFFFPYIAVVIEPRKRIAKNEKEKTSKFGTYLRYKRINNYDNIIRIQMRLLYFLRYYDLTEKEIVDEIAKQFNITISDSIKELELVKQKYSRAIKKTSNTLKTLKNMPKSKPPGISIDIQGRESDNYKIKITGVRTKEQLDEIVNFLKVLIYLYIETYLYEKKEYQKLKEMLKNLLHIAKRRNKVADYVLHGEDYIKVRDITNLDKDRLGFKPDKGQNQYTRSCQNSGENNKRRPDIISHNNVKKLLEDGYKLNNKTGFYEKNIEMKIKGKVYKTIIKAIKLSNSNEMYNYYTCDPSVNKENMYIGFLSKGNNPTNLCMPCCFKKDHSTTNNIKKKNHFYKCLGNNDNVSQEVEKIKNMTDKIYILQDTNKIQDNRFILLSKYLDYFFNDMWNHDKKIKNHYMIESKSGYYLKYTLKHEYYHFLIVISNIYNISIDTIIDNMIKFIEKDKDDKYFTYLNNGDIAESFKEKQFYINYIKTSKHLEYDLIGELIAIPNVISNKGIRFFILNKTNIIIKKALEKDIIKETYYLDCLNLENYYQNDEDRDIIILIKEEYSGFNHYFPIYKVQKDEKINKHISLQKIFSKENNKVLNELEKYHNNSCNNNIINSLNNNINLCAKNIINKEINVIKQYIDNRHKCIYLELDNGLIIPTNPSGISYKIPFVYKQIAKLNLLDINTTIKLLEKLESKLKLDYVPKIVYYDDKKKDNINIISILLNNGLIILIKHKIINENDIKELALSVQFQPLEDIINQAITKYDKQNIYDDRAKHVKEHNYKTESYNLFRLELSNYLDDNNKIKDYIITLIKNKNIENEDKKYELRKILLKIINKKLSDQYKINKKINIDTGNNMIVLMSKIPDLKNYIANNLRDYCSSNKTKDKCENNVHCSWDKSNNKCRLQLLDNMAVDFVNKIINELMLEGIQYKELIQESPYYVSDIIDYSQFTVRNNQSVINISNYNFNKVINELFTQDNVPVIGKKILKNKSKHNDVISKEDVSLVVLGDQYIQKIINNQDSIIRAYLNCYYWINNPLYDIESRNLNYTSDLQTNLTYIFKAQIIDFIQNSNFMENEKIKKYLQNYFKKSSNFFESSLNKFRKTSLNTDGMVELFILSHLIPTIPIVVYDNYLKVKYIFLQGEIKITDEIINNFTKKSSLNKTIFLKFNYENSLSIPNNIYSIYYL